MSVSSLADEFFLRDHIFLSYCVDERKVVEPVFGSSLSFLVVPHVGGAIRHFE